MKHRNTTRQWIIWGLLFLIPGNSQPTVWTCSAPAEFPPTLQWTRDLWLISSIIKNKQKQCGCSIRPQDCHPHPLHLLSLLRVNWCTKESSVRKSPFYRDVWYTQEVVKALPQLKFASIKARGSPADLKSRHKYGNNSWAEGWCALTPADCGQHLVSPLFVFTNIRPDSFISMSVEFTHSRFIALFVFPTQTIPYPYSAWRRKSNSHTKTTLV